MYSLWFDGLFQRVTTKASESNSEAGLMGYGWIILKNRITIARGQGVFARGKGATSGVAEYLALIEGMDALSDICPHGEPVEIHGDAKFIIDQMTGISDVTSPSIRPLHRQVTELSRSFGSILWIWAPRRQNRVADALSRHAMLHLLRSPQFYRATIQAIIAESRQKRARAGFMSLVDLRIYQPRVFV
jgi:ribonuclease HI